LNPRNQFIATRRCLRLRACTRRNVEQATIDAHELSECFQRSREHLQSWRYGRFDLVIVEFLVLRAAQPANVQASVIAAQQISSQLDERGHPSFAFFFLFTAVILSAEIDDDELASLARAKAFAPAIRGEKLTGEQSPRQAKYEPPCAPIRHIYERVKAVLHQGIGVALEIAPVVSIHEAGGCDLRPRGQRP
jgi:hypothetical protein